MKIAPFKDRIVSFGCWNQTYLSNGPSVRNENVMAKLKDHPKDLVLVSGDNYYPVKREDKGEKTKEVDLTELKKGFQNLKNATEDCPVFMNFGNHDVVSNDQVDVKKEDLEKG